MSTIKANAIVDAAGTGAPTLTNGAVLPAGSAAAPAISPTGDTNTGIFFPAADTIAFSEGGAEAMRIDSSGNVGIGTSSPVYKLDINSITGWGANQTAPIANIVGANAPTNGGGNLRVLSNTSATADAGGSLVFGGYYTAQTNSIDFAEISGRKQTGQTTGGYLALSTRADLGNSTERMRIDSAGNLLFNSGYGSVATAYGCRAWVNFNGTGTVAIRASGNVTSITDNGTGDYTVNFTTAMPDVNYAVSGTAQRAVANRTLILAPYYTGTYSTSAVRIHTCNDAGPPEDSPIVGVQILR
jgi:hypothetical protein